MSNLLSSTLEFIGGVFVVSALLFNLYVLYFFIAL